MKRKLAGVMLLVFIFFNCDWVSACTAVGRFPVANLGPLTVSRDTPEGFIGTPVTISVVVNCYARDSQSEWVIFPYMPGSNYINETTAAYLYKTNVSGVGVSLKPVAGENEKLVPPQYGRTYRVSVPADKNRTVALTYEVQYYRTPGALGVGTVLPMNLFTTHSYFTPSAPGLSYTVGGGEISMTGSGVTSSTCQVTGSVKSVKLPKVDASSIRNNIGIGTPFNIGMSCDPNVNVKITLTDAAMPSNTTGVLTPAPGSTSSGVGLQILNSQGIVKFGPDSSKAGNLNQWTVGPSSGLANIPLKVQYVSTGVVKPGTIKGLMSYTLSYQ